LGKVDYCRTLAVEKCSCFMTKIVEVGRKEKKREL
jgi:hypothetical protein